MKIISICSGGLDSVSYTAGYIKDGHDVEIITFNYGQKATKEIERLKEIFPNNIIKVIDISFMKELWPKTQLTDDTEEVKNDYTPSVVVPLRNAVFTTIAVAYGMSVEADRVILGSHADDVTIADNDFMYPDCDSRFFQLLETTLCLGHLKKSRRVEIWSPSREHIGKSGLVKSGYNILQDKIFQTWSCYLSADKQCGICESCRNRKKAFEKAKVEDKTEYQE